MVAGALRHRILGLVLAGGKSRRFGFDKATAMLAGITLAERAAQRAAPQVERLLVNRNDGWPLTLPFSVLNDRHPGEGPLAGVLAGLAHASEQGFTHLATFSCDAPFFPHDCVERLMAALTDSSAEACFARSGDVMHWTFALLRAGCAPALEAAFANGLRSLHGTREIVPAVEAIFPPSGEAPGGDAFFNINTPKDMALAGRWLARGQARPPGRRRP
ncbi:MAG: molybdenum cofactor guanylyltransferase [Proteobacteria bacterium]|nr:molybdenum cofactor guanylyltransferase [Pseudomonadota bacterium]